MRVSTLHALPDVLRSYHSHIISDLGSVLFEQPFHLHRLAALLLERMIVEVNLI